MKTTIRVLTTALVLAVLALPLAAQAPAAAPSSIASYDASGAYSLLNHPRALARFLHLSPAQTATLLTLANTLDQAVDPLRQARVPLCQTFETDLAAASPDPSTVGADSLALYDNRQMIVAARKTFDTNFSAILSPGQLATYDALKQLAASIDKDLEVIGDCPKP